MWQMIPGRSGMRWPFDAQPAATFEHVADNVFVGVDDLLWVQVFGRTKGDQTAGELFFLEAVDSGSRC